MSSSRVPAIDVDPVLQGGGECGALMRAAAWSSSPLGMPSAWPQELRVVVALALGSKQPMLIVWGSEQVTLYNDGYAAMCGARHPAALGNPFRDLWYDIWEQVKPIISAAYEGISTSMDDIEFIMHRNGYPEETHFAFSYSPVRDAAGRVLGMFCACVETTGAVLMQRQLARERQHMRKIFESALGAVAIINGPEHVFTFANRDYQTLVGQRELVGRKVADALPEVVEQGFVDLLDTVFTTGKAFLGRGGEVELKRAAGGVPEKRSVDFGYHPITGPDGQSEGIFVQALDITERAEADRRQELLNLELGHRMKNQLALVQAIVNQTLRSATDLAEARASLMQRIAVLSRAQELLLSGAASVTTLEAILQEVASLHGGPSRDRFRISGPHQVVGPRPALSLSLILHELSTNAAKYGALSAEHGLVSIEWNAQPKPDGEQLILVWKETGGPPVSPPDHSGSGTRLLRAGVSGDQFSEVELSFHPSGVVCTIRVSVEDLQAP